jgi:hypothetical protein
MMNVPYCEATLLEKKERRKFQSQLVAERGAE